MTATKAVAVFSVKTPGPFAGSMKGSAGIAIIWAALLEVLWAMVQLRRSRSELECHMRTTASCRKRVTLVFDFTTRSGKFPSDFFPESGSICFSNHPFSFSFTRIACTSALTLRTRQTQQTLLVVQTYIQASLLSVLAWDKISWPPAWSSKSGAAISRMPV